MRLIFFELGMRLPNPLSRGKLTMTNWRPAALYRAPIALASRTIDVLLRLRHRKLTRRSREPRDPESQMDAYSHPNWAHPDFSQTCFLETPIVPEPRTEKTATREVNAAQAKVDSQIDAFLSARNSDPFAVLGPQPVATPAGPRWVIRFFDPHAYSATISGPGIPSNLEAQKRRSEGLFEVTLPETYKDKPDPSKYKHSLQDLFRRYLRALRHLRVSLTCSAISICT